MQVQRCNRSSNHDVSSVSGVQVVCCGLDAPVHGREDDGEGPHVGVGPRVRGVEGVEGVVAVVDAEN